MIQSGSSHEQEFSTHLDGIANDSERNHYNKIIGPHIVSFVCMNYRKDKADNTITGSLQERWSSQHRFGGKVFIYHQKSGIGMWSDTKLESCHQRYPGGPVLQANKRSVRCHTSSNSRYWLVIVVKRI